jgi:uncharacterized membrane protein YgaE (UPF0421/DUF939 family)
MKIFGVDLFAVIAGVAVGIATAIISHLLLGQNATVIAGSLVAASFTASAVTKARLQ